MATRSVYKKQYSMCKCRRTQRKHIKKKQVAQSHKTEKIDFLLGMQQILPCLGSFYFELLTECYENFLFNLDESPVKDAMLERLFVAMGELDFITSAVADSEYDDDDDLNSRVTNRECKKQMPNVDNEDNQASPDFSTKLLGCMAVARERGVSKAGGCLRKHEEFHQAIRSMQETFSNTL